MLVAEVEDEEEEASRQRPSAYRQFVHVAERSVACWAALGKMSKVRNSLNPVRKGRRAA